MGRGEEVKTFQTVIKNNQQTDRQIRQGLVDAKTMIS